MGLILKLLHAGCAASLLAAHGVFFFRGLAIEAGRISPAKLDRLARGLSQALLPVTVLSGLLPRLAASHQPAALHLILGIAPLITIPLAYFLRRLLNKRHQAPWLLPAVNLILLSAAVLTGAAAWRS